MGGRTTAAAASVRKEPRLTPAWYPDWRGQFAAVVASGPSAKNAGVAALRGRVKVVAIKESVELCPWTDVVYGCDAPWWRHRRGLPEFKGLKIAYADKIPDGYPDISGLRIAKDADQLLMDEPGLVGSGGNSGFHAVNMLAQWGVKGLLLVGFDMSGSHWYGRNAWHQANNPTEMNFDRWLRAFGNAAPQLATMGIDVVNAAPHSRLTCFRKASIAETLARWGV